MTPGKKTARRIYLHFLSCRIIPLLIYNSLMREYCTGITPIRCFHFFMTMQYKEQNTDEWTTIISESSPQLFTVLKEPKCQLRIQHIILWQFVHVLTSHGMCMHVHVCGQLLNPADSNIFWPTAMCHWYMLPLLSILQQVHLLWYVPETLIL